MTTNASRLTLAELATLGADELLALARARELSPRHMWVAAKGSKKYLAAVARGDIADDVLQMQRARKCERCVLAPLTWTKVVGGGMDEVEKGWCGKALEDPQDSGACGCLVLLRIEGEVVPGAKPAVESEECPIGEW